MTSFSRAGRGWALGLALFLLVTFPGRALPSDVPAVPDSLESAIDYLCFELLAGGEPDPARIAPVIAHVRSHPDVPSSLTALQDAPGAYQGFVLDMSMRRLLCYLYNPGIPQEVIKPFSIRSSEWTTPGTAEEQRRLWTDPWPPAQALAISGEQSDRTTPDLSTGGCYAMTLRRLLVFLPGEMAVLSVSVQPEPSDVGTKGYMVGDDGDGRYVYTGEEGLTRTGLGWVASRVQTNVSIGVYLQGEGHVTCGIFQWMRAGWSGLSVVQESHVAASLERYRRLFSERLGRLPVPIALEAMHARASNLSEAALRSHARGVFSCWLDMFGQHAHKDALELLRAGYELRLDRGELVALHMGERLGLAMQCQPGSAGVQTSRLAPSLPFQPLSTSR